MKKKVIVTGGAGFIGSHLVDLLLKKNFKVIVIDNLSGGRLDNVSHHKGNKNFLLLKKDITDKSIQKLKLNNISYFFHLAGKGDIVPSIENPSSYFNTNLSGTINVLELARRLNIKKFIYAASSSCYGLAKVPTKEINQLDPKYPYALSKLMGEQACMHWAKLYKLPVISIRIFNAYGPRVKTTGVYGAVFGVFFKQKLQKMPFTLVGNGKQKRDFLFVTDVAEAFYKCAISKKKNEIYNLGAGNPQTILRLINILKGKYVKIPKRPGEPECTWADISKIKKDIKWRPKINFSKGVNFMLKDLHKWNDAPLWSPKKINKATKTWFKYLS